MPDDLAFHVLALDAPESEWRDVAELFVECFSAEPYFEDPAELGTISQWGPEMLAGRGRLVTVRESAVLRGFALGHGLDHDETWQGLLRRLEPNAVTDAALAAPHDAFIVHELGVRAASRGQGIARSCMLRLLEGRTEPQTFIGVYERAEHAAEMYRRWGFERVGRVPLSGDAVALRVLAAPTDAAVRRLGAGGTSAGR